MTRIHDFGIAPSSALWIYFIKKIQAFSINVKFFDIFCNRPGCILRAAFLFEPRLYSLSTLFFISGLPFCLKVYQNPPMFGRKPGVCQNPCYSAMERFLFKKLERERKAMFDGAIFHAKITGKTQSDGDQSLDVRDSYGNMDLSAGGRFRAYKIPDDWQAHFEIRLIADGTAHIPTAGSAKIYGVPKGGTEKGKVLIDEIDLKSTQVEALITGWVGVYDKIIVSPSSLDADCEYDFIVTAY